MEEAQALSTMEEDQEEEEEPIATHETKPEKRKKRKKLKATIQVVGEQADKGAPLVGYFPSGFEPQDEGEPEPPRVRVFRHEKKQNRIQLVVSPNGHAVDYVGTSYLGEGATPQTCTYALGVLDKETKTLKIVPIASNKIFRMEARVAGVANVENNPASSLNKELTAAEKADKERELNERYGTKKSNNMAKKRDLMKQQDDPETKENLDRKFKEVVINEDALESAAAHSVRNIPPYDSSATTPEQAYPLDKIILSGEWNFLLDIHELLQAEAEVVPDAYPSFVRNRFDKLWEMQDKEEQKQLACILSYITHLIKFKDQHTVDGRSSAKKHNVPSILRQKFLAMFADTNSRLSNENLLISYVLVLTLFADQFRTDPSDIAKDLRTSPVMLREHFEHLGCKLRQTNKVLLATLPVPLQFPTLKRRRRR